MSGGKVVRNTAYLVTAFVGQKLLSFVYFMVIARTVGAEGAGRYFIAVTFTTLFSIFVDLGLANVLVREVAKFPEKAGALLSNVLGIKAILAALTVIAVQVTARLLDYPPETVLMISIASAVMALDSVHLVLYAVMRGFQNLKYEAVGVVSGQFITIVAGSAFLFLGKPLPFLVLALLLGSSWNVLWSWFSVSRRFGLKAMFSLDRSLVRFFWSVTIPFALAGIFSRVYSYIDTIMLSKMIDEASVGLYGVAYKIAFAFQFMPMAFAAAVYPAMSELYVKDRSKLAALFMAATNYLLLIVAPLTVGIAVLAPEFVLLLSGSEFAGSVAPLRYLMASLVFAFLYWPAGSLLNASDRQAKNTAAMGITMIVNIALNAALIPVFGIEGAGMSALVGNFTLWVAALLSARGVVAFDLRTFVLIAMKTGIAVLCMGAVIHLLRDALNVLLVIPAGAIVYVGVLLLVGGVTVPELRKFADIFLRRGRGVSDLVP
jgi:O-antigen/teichoic acid export membrane protein